MLELDLLILTCSIILFCGSTYFYYRNQEICILHSKAMKEYRLSFQEMKFDPQSFSTLTNKLSQQVNGYESRISNLEFQVAHPPVWKELKPAKEKGKNK